MGFDGDTNSRTLVASVRAASSWSTVTRKLGRLVGGQHDGSGADQRDGLGIGGPVGRGHEHLVTRVQQGREGVVDRVLAAVGHDDLVGQHLVARVAEGLGRDGRLQLGQPAHRAVAVVARVAAGRHGGLDDVVGGREVGLAGAEADHGFAGGLEGLGLGVDGEGGRLGDGGDAAGEAFSFWGHGGLGTWGLGAKSADRRGCLRR